MWRRYAAPHLSRSDSDKVQIGPKSHQFGSIPLQTDRNRSKLDRCRIKSDRYRSKLDRYRIKSDRCRSKLDRCRIKSDRCRSKLDRYLIKSDRCRSKLDRCRIKSDRYRIKLERYRSKLDRCHIESDRHRIKLERCAPSPNGLKLSRAGGGFPERWRLAGRPGGVSPGVSPPRKEIRRGHLNRPAPAPVTSKSWGLTDRRRDASAPGC
jgi:hypothetical protein